MGQVLGIVYRAIATHLVQKIKSNMATVQKLVAKNGDQSVVDVIFFNNQEEFSDWLEEHPEASELWVGYFRKSTGRASLTWSTSVDVALCFGWIDGIRKTIDEQSYKIRFTPRKIKSVWSAVNVKKVETLIPLGKMKPAGMHVFNNRSDAQGYTSEDRNVPLADEYLEQIKANQPATSEFLIH